MKELFDKFLMYFCLTGIGTIAVVAFVRVTLPAAATKVCGAARKAKKVGPAVIIPILCVAGLIVYGSTKNNSSTNDPPAQTQMIVRPGQFVDQKVDRIASDVVEASPVQKNGQTTLQSVETADAPVVHALVRVEKWWRRGAYDDGQVLTFDEGWFFPHGTNHLTSIEVWASGAVYPSEKNPTPIAELVTKLSLAPHDTEVYMGRTTNNTYRIEWHNGHPNRDASQTADASIELFRNGNVVVADGETEVEISYVIPFEHDGFGQDEDWVRANFTRLQQVSPALTNDEEIISIGYANWVDQQVGIGLTNGLYKFTAEFFEDPPEPTQLYVGAYTVCVTNAGEYVFVLEKGEEYEFGTWPFNDGVDYWAQDDLGADAPVRATWWGGWESPGEWTIDGGWLDLYWPSSLYLGYCRWMPTLVGFPNVGHLREYDFPCTFQAHLSDYAHTDTVGFRWTTPNEDVRIVSPNARETVVCLDALPNYGRFEMQVSTEVGGCGLVSSLGTTYGESDQPQVTMSIVAPEVLLLRSCWMEGSRSALACIGFRCDVETNGTLEAWIDAGAAKLESPLTERISIPLSSESAWRQDYVIDGVVVSDQVGDVRICCRYLDQGGNESVRCSKALTIIRPDSVSVPSAPATGLVILQGSAVGVGLATSPQCDDLSVEWQVARRKTKSEYESWTTISTGSTQGDLTFVRSGVHAIRARTICGVQSNQVEYVRHMSERWSDVVHDNIGPCEAGERDHIGVSSSEALIAIRNEALRHLNTEAYTKGSRTPAMHGFSGMGRKTWKCNLFVAHVATSAGYPVPIQHRIAHNWPLEDSMYPPLANEWGLGSPAIVGWTHMPPDTYPEPGMIAGRPQVGGVGHCGIVDYDGWTISARSKGVSRNAAKMLDGTCGYNIPEITNE